MLKNCIVLWCCMLVGLSCAAQSKSTMRGSVVETYSNKKLLKRQYFFVNRKIRATVSFDTVYKQVKIEDSVLFQYDKSSKITGITIYKYSRLGYKKTRDIGLEEYYKRFYYTGKLPFVIKHGELLNDVLDEFCTVHEALLPNGKLVNLLRKQFKQGNVDIIEYANLDARFRDLSPDVQIFFYNRVLCSLHIEIEGQLLKSELLIFDNGTFERVFLYKSGRLIETLNLVKTDGLDVNFKNRYKYY